MAAAPSTICSPPFTRQLHTDDRSSPAVREDGHARCRVIGITPGRSSDGEFGTCNDRHDGRCLQAEWRPNVANSKADVPGVAVIARQNAFVAIFEYLPFTPVV